MIKFNFLSVAFTLSLIIHFIFIYQLKESKKIEEIYVVDLSSHREFKPREIPQKSTKQTNTKSNEEIIKKKEINEIKKKKDIIPIKKKEIKKENKKIETKKAINEEKTKIIKKEKVKKVEKIEKKKRYLA